MKKINLWIVGALCCLFSSCEEWFEVKAENEITREDLFSSYDGFRSALNGIYRKMSETDLYGQELMWGWLSFLGQNYNESVIWDVSSGYLAAAQYNYELDNFKNIASGVWEKGYNVIANCNSLIQEIGQKDSSFFYEGNAERNLLLGEAKGLRALMHFDLLRLFAPAPATGDAAAYIPYVTVYPTFQPKHLPTAEVLDSIIADLTTARNLLAFNDTSDNAGMMSTMAIRFHSNFVSDSKYGSFFAYRGTRMNYFAATALLARAYLYKQDKINALRYAEMVYRYATDKGIYHFTPSDKLDSDTRRYRHCKLPEDILLAFSNSKMYTIYTDWHTANYFFNRFSIKNTEDLFEGDRDDFRLSKMIYEGYSLKWEPVTEDPDMPWMNSDIVEYESKMLPVIRLSEVYYILCECLAETDLPRAIALLTELRVARGAKTALNTGMAADVFLRTLYQDATREFIAEGQTFYLYKRLNQKMYNGSTPIEMGEKYMIPLPLSERAYY